MSHRPTHSLPHLVISMGTDPSRLPASLRSATARSSPSAPSPSPQTACSSPLLTLLPTLLSSSATPFPWLLLLLLHLLPALATPALAVRPRPPPLSPFLLRRLPCTPPSNASLPAAFAPPAPAPSGTHLPAPTASTALLPPPPQAPGTSSMRTTAGLSGDPGSTSRWEHQQGSHRGQQGGFEREACSVWDAGGRQLGADEALGPGKSVCVCRQRVDTSADIPRTCGHVHGAIDGILGLGPHVEGSQLSLVPNL